MSGKYKKKTTKDPAKKAPKSPPRMKFSGLAKTGQSKKQKKEIQILVFRTQVENVEIAYLRNDLGDEGFANTLFKTVITSDPAYDEDIDAIGIRKLFFQRVDLEHNTAKPCIKKPNYNRRYYVRIHKPDAVTTSESRQELLEELRLVCSQEAVHSVYIMFIVSQLVFFQFFLKPGNESGYGHEYVVKEDSDETPELLLPLDNYIMDNDVAIILTSLYDSEANNSFFENYNDLALQFFSMEPYCTLARTRFGYIKVEDDSEAE